MDAKMTSIDPTLSKAVSADDIDGYLGMKTKTLARVITNYYILGRVDYPQRIRPRLAPGREAPGAVGSVVAARPSS